MIKEGVILFLAVVGVLVMIVGLMRGGYVGL